MEETRGVPDVADGCGDAETYRKIKMGLRYPIIPETAVDSETHLIRDFKMTESG